MIELLRLLTTVTTARAIQDQLLKDFSAKSEFSDWFPREDVDDVPRPPAIVKPNPRNIEHDEKIVQLEERIKRLVCAKEERPGKPIPRMSCVCAAR